ncbi:MAG: PDZ domain-containing protein [Planctomycetaceae bacterium]|nr:PDZ domain-containing protein [Planctomycetaceae bacterium]
MKQNIVFRSSMRSPAIYCIFLILISASWVRVQAAEILDPEIHKKLLELKQFCDDGLIEPEVCKEKQRQILGLPQAVSTPGEAPSETSGEAQTKEPERGFLGVVVEPVSADSGDTIASAAGEGAAVVRVLEDSPAERAGVTAGDVIVELGDQVVPSADLFAELEAALTPGAKVPLKVVRSAGEESVLYATIIDRRKYPPARAHTSPLGFTITLPAGWTLVGSSDLEPFFERFTQLLGETPLKTKYLEAKKAAAAMEYYALGKTSVSAGNQNVAFPTSHSASVEMCTRFAANRSKTANPRAQIHDCGLRTIGGSQAFCLDQDARSQNMRMKHCWIKKPSQGTLKLTLTIDEKHEASSVDDFEKMIASLKWQ